MSGINKESDEHSLIAVMGEGMSFDDQDQTSFLSKDTEILGSSLWELLERQCQAYTMGDSSSMPMETADELLQSILFAIGISLKKSGKREAMPLLKADDLLKLFNEGKREIEKEVKRGKKLFRFVKETAVDIDNISYHDTINELGNFFRSYNIDFFSHQIPVSIDYQLAHAMPELKGIEYLNEYLRRLIIENIFIRNFKKESIIALLNSYCPDYREQLINIFEPVYINAVGLTLLKKNMLGLDINDSDRTELLILFKTWDEKEREDNIRQATAKILSLLQIKEYMMQTYIQESGKNLLIRTQELQDNGSFEKLFLSFSERNEQQRIEYLDNKEMDDETLRKLIDEMKSCRFVSDKIIMLRRYVKSVRDLIEVLDNCFFADEYCEVFDLLQKFEIALLLNHLDENNSSWEKSFNDWPLWGQELVEYLDTLEKSESDEIRRIREVIQVSL